MKASRSRWSRALNENDVAVSKLRGGATLSTPALHSPSSLAVQEYSQPCAWTKDTRSPTHRRIERRTRPEGGQTAAGQVTLSGSQQLAHRQVTPRSIRTQAREGRGCATAMECGQEYAFDSPDQFWNGQSLPSLFSFSEFADPPPLRRQNSRS